MLKISGMRSRINGMIVLTNQQVGRLKLRGIIKMGKAKARANYGQGV